jgi:hypothetical protein
VSSKRCQRYQKRKQLLDLREPALRYVTEIVAPPVAAVGGEANRLHEVLQEPGPEILRWAMEEGLNEEGTSFQRYRASHLRMDGATN